MTTVYRSSFILINLSHYTTLNIHISKIVTDTPSLGHAGYRYKQLATFMPHVFPLKRRLMAQPLEIFGK